MFIATQDSLIPKLQTFWRYARVELRPPAPGDWPQIQKGFVNLVQATKNQKWKTLTVKVILFQTNQVLKTRFCINCGIVWSMESWSIEILLELLFYECLVWYHISPCYVNLHVKCSICITPRIFLLRGTPGIGAA